MKYSLWKLFYAFLFLTLITSIVSAQKIDTDKLLDEDKKQEAPQQTTEKPLSTEETKTKENRFFTLGSERTNYYIFDLHSSFSERDKSRLETNLRPGVTFSHRNSPAGISGFNRKTNQNLQTDAVETLDTDEQPIQEVFQTQLVYPQERGEVQFTFNSRYGRSSSQSLFQTPVSIEYGITKNWQVEVEWDAQSRRNEFGEPLARGTGDLSFGTQYSFMNVARSNFHTAVGLEITLPTADVEKELTEGLSQSTISKGFLDNILASMTDTLIVIDDNLTIEKVNQATLNLLGYEEAELKGKSIKLILAEKSFTEPELKELTGKGFIRNIKKTYLAKDGGEIPVSFSASVINGDDGQSQGIVCVAQDITERKRAVEELSKLAAIVESSNDVIMSVDLKGTITSWNKGAEKVFGYAASETVGENMSLLLPPELRNEQAEIIKKVKAGELVKQFESVRVRKDGIAIPISITLSPIRNAKGKLIALSGIISDISERVEVENALRESEKKNRELIENAKDMIYTMDLSGAEDNPVNQKVAKRQVEKLGVNADVVANGVKALEALDKVSYDIVLMDCQMPEMDGYEATAEIRRREGEDKHTVIIAMTANSMQGDHEKCLAAGMDDYIGKPIRFDEFQEVLQRWIKPKKTKKISDVRVEAIGDAIDMSVLDSFCKLQDDGEPDLVAELVELYINDTQARLTEIQTALKEKDTQALQIVAHSLKGSSGNLGIRRMAEICVVLEENLKKNSWDKAEAQVSELESEFLRVRQVLESKMQMVNQ